MEIKNEFSLEEELYTLYINMRRQILIHDNYKYESNDPLINSNDFKSGFFAGIKIMLSLSINQNNINL